MSLSGLNPTAGIAEYRDLNSKEIKTTDDTNDNMNNAQNNNFDFASITG